MAYPTIDDVFEWQMRSGRYDAAMRQRIESQTLVAEAGAREDIFDDSYSTLIHQIESLQQELGEALQDYCLTGGNPELLELAESSAASLTMLMVDDYENSVIKGEKPASMLGPKRHIDICELECVYKEAIRAFSQANRALIGNALLGIRKPLLRGDLIYVMDEAILKGFWNTHNEVFEYSFRRC